MSNLQPYGRVDIEGKQNIERDLHSKALINTDIEAYNQRLADKKRFEEMNRLKKDVNDIKNVLGEILVKLDK